MGLSAPAPGLYTCEWPSSIFSETAWRIKVKFRVEPTWEGGTKLCITIQGDMTKLAATPIHGINLFKSSSQELKSYDLETLHVAPGSQTTNLV